MSAPTPFERALADALGEGGAHESLVVAKAGDSGPAYRWVLTPIRDPVSKLIVQIVSEAIPVGEPIPEPPTA